MTKQLNFNDVYKRQWGHCCGFPTFLLTMGDVTGSEVLPLMGLATDTMRQQRVIRKEEKDKEWIQMGYASINLKLDKFVLI